MNFFRSIERGQSRIVHKIPEEIPAAAIEPDPLTEKFQKTSDEVRALLASGDWVRASKVRKICSDNLISFINLADRLLIAESEDGWWICIPNDNTPYFAPNEWPKD